MPKDTRENVTLSPEAYKVLEIEAMLHDSSLKDAASKLIIKAACPKCKEILDIMARPAKEPKGEMTQESQVTITQEPKTISPQKPNVTVAQGPKSPKAKGKKLSKDPLALTKIKELYAREPRPSLAEMARQIGYPKGTIHDAVQRMKKSGELVD